MLVRKYSINEWVEIHLSIDYALMTKIMYSNYT